MLDTGYGTVYTYYFAFKEKDMSQWRHIHIVRNALSISRFFAQCLWRTLVYSSLLNQKVRPCPFSLKQSNMYIQYH